SCLALDLPKPMTPPRPPPCIRLIRKMNRPSRMIIGSMNTSSEVNQLSWLTSVSYSSTSLSASVSNSCAATPTGAWGMILSVPQGQQELLLLVLDLRRLDVAVVELGHRHRGVDGLVLLAVTGEVEDPPDHQQYPGDDREVPQHRLAVHTSVGLVRPDPSGRWSWQVAHPTCHDTRRSGRDHGRGVRSLRRVNVRTSALVPRPLRPAL